MTSILNWNKKCRNLPIIIFHSQMELHEDVWKIETFESFCNDCFNWSSRGFEKALKHIKTAHVTEFLGGGICDISAHLLRAVLPGAPTACSPPCPSAWVPACPASLPPCPPASLLMTCRLIHMWLSCNNRSNIHMVPHRPYRPYGKHCNGDAVKHHRL